MLRRKGIPRSHREGTPPAAATEAQKNHPNPKRYQTSNKKVRAITTEEWNRIVEVYRRYDGRISLVAEHLGWLKARTQRAWRRGYRSLGLPPIRTLLARDALAAEEVRAARAELSTKLPPSVQVKERAEIIHSAEVMAKGEARRIAAMVEMEETRRKARQDAIEARTEEAMLVSINRRNSLALNGVTAKMLKGALALSETIQAELEAEARSDRLTVAQKLNLVRSAASIARFNSEASMLAVKAERMVLGQPIDAPDEKMDETGSLADTDRWLQITIKAVTRARERGVLPPDASSSEGR